MEQAHIIFSPYNYLIDPRVRQSMKIPINDNVIILDEAHNIEDSARESAGGTFSQEDFRLALNDCEKVGHGPIVILHSPQIPDLKKRKEKKEKEKKKKTFILFLPIDRRLCCM